MADTNPLILIFTGAVGGGLVTSSWNSIRDWAKANKEGQFAALYLAVALEEYADEALTDIYDSMNYEGSQGSSGAAVGNIPKLAYPADLNWSALGIRTTAIALTFKINIDGVRSMIAASWEFGDEDEIVPEVRDLLVKHGLEAWDYAVAFRRAWNLERVAPDDDGNTLGDNFKHMRTRFMEKRSEKEERIRKRREARAALETSNKAKPDK